jgi:hypothetical protein
MAMHAQRILIAAVMAAVMMTGTVAAQWLTHPTAGVPRLPDGKPNLAAPVPKHASGKPVLAGLWRPSPGMVGDIARNLKPGEVPYQPWAEALFKERRANSSKDDPTANCIVGGVPRSDLVGYPFKILEVPGMVVILYEAVHSYRQIFTDGRPFPADMNPSWFGYSVGHWEGDALVVETTNFHPNGNPMGGYNTLSDQNLRLVERFRRTAADNIEYTFTVDNPTMWTKAWTAVINWKPSRGEVLEYACHEGNYSIRGMLAGARADEAATTGR